MNNFKLHASLLIYNYQHRQGKVHVAKNLIQSYSCYKGLFTVEKKMKSSRKALNMLVDPK